MWLSRLLSSVRLARGRTTLGGEQLAIAEPARAPPVAAGPRLVAVDALVQPASENIGEREVRVEPRRGFEIAQCFHGALQANQGEPADIVEFRGLRIELDGARDV